MTKKKKVVCGDCGKPMVKKKDKFGVLKFLCPDYPICRGVHNIHSYTGRALGFPGDEATRTARGKAHRLFDKWWKGDSSMNRSRAYKELQKIMGKEEGLAHIAKFTKEECDFLITYLGGINDGR